MRFKLVIEYDGSRYHGWQVQQGNVRTIQGELLRACAEVFKSPVREVYGAGRTDSGVHAFAQVAHLDVDTPLIPEHVLLKLNDALPSDINLMEVSKAHPKFHARHDATARSYVYHISRRRSAFGKRYVWWVKDPLDLDAMRDAAGLLAGFGDYRALADESPEQRSSKVDLHFTDIHERGDLIVIHTAASHFLWKMVRRMVGVLVEVGRNNLDPDDLSYLLRAGSKAAAQHTAPPAGLFLEKIYYRGETVQRGKFRHFGSV
jgi:tRNA pseudouridine38-40 synthase